MPDLHPLLEGLDAIGDQYLALADRTGLFAALYERIRTNWMRYREPDRWPTPDKNWVLRVAPDCTYDPTRYLEKQLQKAIARCLEHEDWGNDIPTASGLVNSRGRQMNIDLGHCTADGYEFIELKVRANIPSKAALQVLRYGAVYLLYRLDPELARRFKAHAMLRAKRITLEVLAPRAYYLGEQTTLPDLETQLNQDLAIFAIQRAVGVRLAFRFMAFPPGFTYHPDMDCEEIRDAVHRRASPFGSHVLPET